MTEPDHNLEKTGKMSVPLRFHCPSRRANHIQTREVAGKSGGVLEYRSVTDDRWPVEKTGADTAPPQEIGEVRFADGCRQSCAGGRRQTHPFFQQRGSRLRDFNRLHAVAQRKIPKGFHHSASVARCNRTTLGGKSKMASTLKEMSAKGVVFEIGWLWRQRGAAETDLRRSSSSSCWFFIGSIVRSSCKSSIAFALSVCPPVV